MRKIGELILFPRGNKLLLLVAFAFMACSTSRPTLDYVLAREAFSAAKEVDAARYSPGYFHKAEESFRSGERNYREHIYEEAIQDFKAAKAYSEKAENAARVMRQKAGDEGM